MQFGFGAPVGGPLGATDSLVRIVTEAEAMGYDYLTVSDHVVIPADIQARYPYSETGEFPGGGRGGRHEQLIELAFLAAKTTRLRLVTSVMVVPHRPALLTAKMLATIDVLSGGRLTLGIGAGWLKEEFDALETPPFAERGKVTDDYIRAFKELWTNPDPHFDSPYSKFSGIFFEPKPVQKPHPPIWIGGESGPALRRTARLGDGWYPIGTNPAFPLDSLPRLQAALARLRKLTAEAGRNPDDIAIAYRIQRHGPEQPARAGDGERNLFSGTPAELAEDLRNLKALGVGHIDIGTPGATPDAALATLKAFRDNVLARL